MFRKKKKIPLNYFDASNSKELLLEFSKRFPDETNRFLFEVFSHKNAKIMDIKISIDNPPRYEHVPLSKKNQKKFKKLKLHIHYRRVLISFMEWDLVGRNPRLVFKFE